MRAHQGAQPLTRARVGMGRGWTHAAARKSRTNSHAYASFTRTLAARGRGRAAHTMPKLPRQLPPSIPRLQLSLCVKQTALPRAFSGCAPDFPRLPRPAVTYLILSSYVPSWRFVRCRKNGGS
eukprot:6174445-Pleurochrysis_carterae.AAC.2